MQQLPMAPFTLKKAKSHLFCNVREHASGQVSGLTGGGGIDPAPIGVLNKQLLHTVQQNDAGHERARGCEGLWRGDGEAQGGCVPARGLARRWSLPAGPCWELQAWHCAAGSSPNTLRPGSPTQRRPRPSPRTSFTSRFGGTSAGNLASKAGLRSMMTAPASTAAACTPHDLPDPGSPHRSRVRGRACTGMLQGARGMGG